MNNYTTFLFSLMIGLAGPWQGTRADEPTDAAEAASSAEDGSSTGGQLRDFNTDLIYQPPPKPPEPTQKPVAQNKVKAYQIKPARPQTKGGKAPPVAKPPQVKSQAAGVQLTLHNQQSRLIRVTVDSSVSMDLKEKVDLAQVTDPTIADILIPTTKKIVVVGKSVGTTQLLLQMGKRYVTFHVRVEPNFSVLMQMIKNVSPSSEVQLGALKGKTIVTGRVPDAQTSQRIEELAAAFQGGEVVNHLSVAGVQQTLLHVVVAEVNKEAMRSLGINWAVGGSKLSRDFFFANNIGQLNPTLFSSAGLPDVTQGQQLFSVAPTVNSPETNVTFGFPRAELQYFLNALRENNLARTLAEPNLVAISGQTATFLAGGEVPVPVTQGGAVAGAITIQYKEFGVRLAFTPTVSAGEIIRIHVMSEVSDAIPDSQQIGGLPVFTFTTRRVESTIEIGNGQTFAIAGLLNDRVQAIASKIPGLGDIPVLGALFSSVNYQKSRTELVVLVTPRLVEPLEPQQVVPPLGALTKHPTDFELFGLQKLEGGKRPVEGTEWAPSAKSKETKPQEAVSAAPSAGGLQGPWGFENPEGTLSDD